MIQFFQRALDLKRKSIGCRMTLSCRDLLHLYQCQTPIFSFRYELPASAQGLTCLLTLINYKLKTFVSINLFLISFFSSLPVSKGKKRKISNWDNKKTEMEVMKTKHWCLAILISLLRFLYL